MAQGDWGTLADEPVKYTTITTYEHVRYTERIRNFITRRNPKGDGRKGTGQKMSYIVVTFVANCRDIL